VANDTDVKVALERKPLCSYRDAALMNHVGLAPKVRGEICETCALQQDDPVCKFEGAMHSGLPCEIPIQIGSGEGHHQRALGVVLAESPRCVRAFCGVKKYEHVGSRTDIAIIEAVENLDLVSE